MENKGGSKKTVFSIFQIFLAVKTVFPSIGNRFFNEFLIPSSANVLFNKFFIPSSRNVFFNEFFILANGDGISV